MSTEGEPRPIRLSVAQAARQLGISERAVRSRIERGTLTELAGMVRDLQRENIQLAGQIGFLQAQLQAKDHEIGRLLPPPAPATPEPQARSRPWYRRLFRAE